MAGILDSEFMRVLLSGSPYMQSREQERRENVRRDEYTGLLGQYQTQPQQGPPDPNQFGGGLPPIMASGPPPEQFYARAAAIPGYQGLAQGAQANLGAMNRQRQSQDWSLSNVPLADQQRLQATIDMNNAGLLQQYNTEQARAEEVRRQWNSISPVQQRELDLRGQQVADQAAYHKGQLGISQGNLDWQRSPNNPANIRQPVGPFGMKGEELFKVQTDLMSQDRQVAAAQDVLEYVSRNSVPGQAQNLGERAAVASAWGMIAPAFIAAAQNSGVIQSSEMPRILGIIGDPTAWSKLTDTDRYKVGLVVSAMQAQRGDKYKALGLQAPQLQTGQSFLANAVNQQGGYGTPKGKERPYRPGLLLSEGAQLGN
jgi:hypothetical protein